jgi:acetyl-CoA carboxylase biotin carboxylase subunit
MDSHLYPDYLVPPNYDSLLGKLIVWGEDRNQVSAKTTLLAWFRVEGFGGFVCQQACRLSRCGRC